jgi:hypothetical protein
MPFWCWFFHDWSEWEYQDVDDCSQSRRCLREGCSAVSTRLHHSWSDFSYVASDSCEESRTCERCGAYETQMGLHDWGSWSYDSRRSCQQTRYCDRCQAWETQVEHVWGTWKYAAPNSCDQVRYCIRCNEGVDERYAEYDDHQWSPKLIRIDCYQARKRCSRCGYSENVDDSFHRYGNWSKKDREGRQERYCSDCGTRDERWL